MTRLAIGFDRVILFIVGVSLLAAGVAAWQWQHGHINGGRAIRTSPLLDAVPTWWWPWTTGAAGIILIAVGLRWLATHRPAHRARRVTLVQDGQAVTVNANAVARASARALGAKASVIKASGHATIQSGTPTITLTATVPARDGLRYGIDVATATMRTAGTMLGDTVAIRTVLQTDTGNGNRAVV